MNLQDIKTAVRDYLNNKVTVAISNPLTPEEGIIIGKNEGFCFSITVTNANTANGGISLKNVRYYLSVDNTIIGKLIVPPAPMVARSGCLLTNSVLTPGTQVGHMCLFPPSTDDRNYLYPGESDTIGTIVYATSILKGKAGTPPTESMTNIRFRVFAEIDMDDLFLKNEDSPTAYRILKVQY